MVTMIAHRGESMIAPENTLPAFELAWGLGAAQGIEGDFHLTRDGVLVCMHDENTLRTTGIDRAINAMSLAEFRQLDAGGWKAPVWQQIHPPTLLEVLRTIPPIGYLFLELKSAEPELAAALEADRLQAGLRPEQIVVISFYPEVVRAIRQQLPHLKALLLLSPEQDKTTGKVTPDPAALCAFMKELGAAGVDCCACDLIDAAYVAEVKRAGFEFHVWTVDDVATGVRFVDYGVDSLTTNCASALRRLWPVAPLPQI